MATKQEKEQKNIKNIQFAWIGKDKNKNEVRGEIISSSESAVRMLLRSKGITPIKVSKKGFKLNKEKKITTAEIAVLTRQLSTMMKLPIFKMASAV
jgi:type IV pilus assembly protein PilC